MLVALVFVTYALTTDVISAAKVFPAFALFDLVSDSITHALGFGIQRWFEVSVSVKRIKVYM